MGHPNHTAICRSRIPVEAKLDLFLKFFTLLFLMETINEICLSDRPWDRSSATCANSRRLSQPSGLAAGN